MPTTTCANTESYKIIVNIYLSMHKNNNKINCLLSIVLNCLYICIGNLFTTNCNGGDTDS